MVDLQRISIGLMFKLSSGSYRTRIHSLCLLLIISLMSVSVQAQVEEDLKRSVNALLANDLVGARENLAPVLQQQSNFELAQWLNAYVNAKLANEQLPPIGRFDGLISELIVRQKLWDDTKAVYPQEVLYLSPEIPYVLVADTLKHKMILYKNTPQGLNIVKQFYLSIGKKGFGKQVEGDEKTPEGIYFLSGFIESEELPDRYGSGAFPLNYPNFWDTKMNRTGHGIWLHGTDSSVFARPPLDSDGCLVLPNSQINELRRLIQMTDNRVPIIVSHKVQWTPDKTDSHQFKVTTNGEISHAWDAWKQTLTSGDSDAMFAYYSQEFSNEKLDYQQWLQWQKKRIEAGYFKEGIDLNAIVSYSDELLAVINFYRQTIQGRQLFRQYWHKQADGWKIVFEGAL